MNKLYLKCIGQGNLSFSDIPVVISDSAVCN